MTSESIDSPARGTAEPESEGRTGWPQNAAVLVVEDDPLIGLNLVQMLEMLGFEARLAPRAEKALAMLAEGPAPVLLLTDLRLPGMNGVALAMEARRSHPGLPVLLTTGQAQDELNLPAELTKRTGFLGKPYAMRQLEAALSALRQQTREDAGTGQTSA
ncbi:response regulator [Pseudoroseomonas globiformis]|uniref:Response regulator n=1 Tax=Teichococcus globiformis TaxID=2307229 RepID=A0ABV7G6K3_9PROT